MASDIHEVFDIDPPSVPTTLDVKDVVIEDSKDAEDADFDYARGNYYEIIEQGKAGITTAMMIAAETQNPRAIEVLSGLLKNMADVNKQLVQMSKDKQDVKISKAQATGKVAPVPSGAGGTTQNVTFIGTSADLNRLLAEKLAGMNKGQ